MLIVASGLARLERRSAAIVLDIREREGQRMSPRRERGRAEDERQQSTERRTGPHVCVGSPDRRPCRCAGALRLAGLDRSGEHVSAGRRDPHWVVLSPPRRRRGLTPLRQLCTCRILHCIGDHRDAHPGIRAWRAGSDAQPPLCSTSASEKASECRHGESEGVPRMSANHRPNVERAPTCVLARRTVTARPVRRGAEALARLDRSGATRQRW
jgi:hypothetical protein